MKNMRIRSASGQLAEFLKEEIRSRTLTEYAIAPAIPKHSSSEQFPFAD